MMDVHDVFFAVLADLGVDDSASKPALPGKDAAQVLAEYRAAHPHTLHMQPMKGEETKSNGNGVGEYENNARQGVGSVGNGRGAMQ